MRDISSIKGLCKSHIAGHLDFETYRKERAEILDSLLPTQPLKAQADKTLAQGSSIKPVRGFLGHCSGFKLITCVLLGIFIVVGVLGVALLYLV